MWLLRRSLLAFVMLGLCLANAGCGQKGPLYLPEDDSQEEQQQPATAPGQ
jgi:predicted small lipoprotein YifL